MAMTSEFDSEIESRPSFSRTVVISIKLKINKKIIIILKQKFLKNSKILWNWLDFVGRVDDLISTI